TGRYEAMGGLPGDGNWNWRTWEAQQLLAWLRRWNLDPRHAKVHVYGWTDSGAEHVVAPLRAFLAKVDAARAEAIAPTLQFLVAPRQGDELARARGAIEAIVADFDRNRARWTARTGANAWRLARQHARFFAIRAHVAADPSARESSMAESVR